MEVLSLCNGPYAEGYSRHLLELCAERKGSRYDPRAPVSIQWRTTESESTGLTCQTIAHYYLGPLS